MIIVGCCNGKPGLLFIGDKDTPNFIHKQDTRGTCYVPERDALYYVTRGGLAVWQGVHNAEAHPAPIQLAPGARDWHGLVYYGGSLWATDPVEDVIFEFGLDGETLNSWHWKDAKEGRLHTNDIWWDGDDLWLSCFNWGIVKNGQMQELGKGMQPHSPIIYKNSLWFCASNRGEVHDMQGDVFCAPGGFTRGLLATEEGLWVGSSAQRHGCGGATARIQLYDWDGTCKKTIPLPTNEVYSITTTEMGAGHGTA